MGMLILTRRVSETVYIDNKRIKVTVLAVHGMQVRLGFDAPRDLNIVREELVVKDEANNIKEIGNE